MRMNPQPLISARQVVARGFRIAACSPNSGEVDDSFDGVVECVSDLAMLVLMIKRPRQKAMKRFWRRRFIALQRPLLGWGATLRETWATSLSAVMYDFLAESTSGFWIWPAIDPITWRLPAAISRFI